jgi:hypothetical protein
MESSDKPRVLNKRDYEGLKDILIEDCVYIGRPSIWGNPFTIGRDGTREEVIEWHEVWFMKHPDLIARAKSELKGKHLICFCAPEACHGDLLLKIANEE